MTIYDCTATIDEACHERETYTNEENRQRLTTKFLLQYLKYHADDRTFRWHKASVANQGIFGYRVYTRLMYKAKCIRHEKHHTDAAPKPLLQWPVLSSELDADVTSHILSFLDHVSIGELSRVSWPFYNAALVSRQKHVSLAGCESLAETGVWNFTGMEYFSGRENSHLLTESFLCFLSSSFPRLVHVDLHGCDHLKTYQVITFLNAMRSRLKTLVLKFLPDGYCSWFCKNLSEASSLESLSLTLNREWSQCFEFSKFDGNTSLKELSVIADGVTLLPKDLPNLEVLRLEFVDEEPLNYWKHLAQSRYPNLKRLDITVSNYAYPTLGLSIDTLVSALSTAPNLESFAIRRVQRHSPLDASDDRKSKTFSGEFEERLKELGCDSTCEEGEIKRLLAFASKRKITCTVNTSITKE